MDTNLTFKPKINKLSAQLDEKFKAHVFNGDDLHRWDQLYLMVFFTNNAQRINIYRKISIILIRSSKSLKEKELREKMMNALFILN